MAAVLKTANPQGFVGSNPTPSARAQFASTRNHPPLPNAPHRNDRSCTYSGVTIGLWRIVGAVFGYELRGAEQACTKEIQLRSAVHLSLHELQLGVLPLGLSV